MDSALAVHRLRFAFTVTHRLDCQSVSMQVTAQ